MNIFVSTTGKDSNSGLTKAAPVATIERARDLRRGLSAREKVNIYVEKGIYFQKDKLFFDNRDGNTAYKAEPGTVISGGTEIFGWRNNGGNIWKASLPESFPSDQYISNLYLDDIVATMSRKPLVEAKSVDTENYIIVFDKKSGFPVGNKNKDIFLHYAFAWQGMILPVEKTEECGEDIKVYLKNEGGVAECALSCENGTPKIWAFEVINAVDFLKPGEFYYNRADRELYYYAIDNQDPNRYVTIVPRLETVMEINGGDSLHRVKNLSFEGFQFSHTMSQRAYKYGVAAAQAWQDMSYVDDINYNYPNSNMGTMIKVFHTDNLKFINNDFCRSNSCGLGLFDGTYRANVSRNTFYDLGASAMMIGSGGAPPKDYEAESGLTNVSIGKPVSVSDKKSLERRNDPVRATDGSHNFGYSLPVGEWLQIDLEEQYMIEQIVLVSRQKGLEIYGSNDEHFKREELLSRSEDFPAEIADYTGYPGRLDIYEAKHIVKNNNKFRYIRVYNKAKELVGGITNIYVMSPDLNGAKRWDLVYDCKVSNNYITRCCTEHQMQCTATIIFTDSLWFTHNEFTETPYTTINMGTNHHLISYSVAKDNVIGWNKTYGASQRMQDGGPLYTSGPQKGTKIIGNYFKGQVYGMAGIYPDQGSAYYEITENIVEAVPKGLFPWALDSHDLDIHHNYSSTPTYEFNVPTNVIFNTEVFVRNNMPQHIRKIASKAGIIPRYRKIRQRVPKKNTPSYLHTNKVFDWTDYSLLYYEGICWDFLKCACEEAEFLLETFKDNTSVNTDKLRSLTEEAKGFVEKYVDGIVLKDRDDMERLKEYYELTGKINFELERFTCSRAVKSAQYNTMEIEQGVIRQCVIDEYYGGHVEYKKRG